MERVKFHNNIWCWGESWKVILNEGVCVGDVSISKEHPEECFISGVSTVPEARRQGLASLFLQLANKIAKDHDCAYLALYVEKEQRENVAFYEKRGFTKFANDGVWFEMRKEVE